MLEGARLRRGDACDMIRAEHGPSPYLLDDTCWVPIAIQLRMVSSSIDLSRLGGMQILTPREDLAWFEGFCAY